MATVEQFLAACENHIGTVESPSGSNCNPFSKILGRPCEPWCADAVAAIAKEVGIVLPGYSAYTPTMADSFRLAGRWTHTPQPGAIPFMDFPDRFFGIQHVGVVKELVDGNYNKHYEGNTSSGQRGSQDNGGGFYEKVRHRSVIVGYGLPPFEAEPVTVGPHAVVLPDEELELGAIAVRSQGGYLIVGHDGGVFNYDSSPYFGSIPEHPEWNVGANVVGAAWTPTGNGYWICTRDGAVFTFGDAAYHGGFNALSPEVRGSRYVMGMVAEGNGYRQIAFDPSADGSPFDPYEFGV